jgi:multidrug resistance protein
MFSPRQITSTEKKAMIGLSSIMSLRMLGLFMVLPVFSLYANQLQGATPTLIGLSLGIYGLTQAFFQIPFGTLSDRFGRKPLILIGLLFFAIGSIIAAMTHSIYVMIIGRALQGMGAIGSTTLAMLADLTREEQRTKSMAIAGMSIGLAFSLAILLGPILIAWMPVNFLFFLAVLLSILAIFILYFYVPTPTRLVVHNKNQTNLTSFCQLIAHPEIAKLNFGIFILHLVFTASFVIIPMSLAQHTSFTTTYQWLVYAPTLLAAFIATLIMIGVAEKYHQLKLFFIINIIFLMLGEYFLWLHIANPLLIFLGLFLFFTGFSTLEAFLPSLISRTAPMAKKGSALGLYSSAQFLGIFMGGILGGWLYGNYHFPGVYIFCFSLSLFWLILTFFMQPPAYCITEVWRLTKSSVNWGELAEKLRVLPGMLEVIFVVEDGIAYLKMERGTVRHPDFIRLKKYSTET